MPCYHPIQAYRRIDGEVVFVERGDIQYSMQLPCGQCVGCRLERSRQWAVRCMHEAQMHERNCFITLTYREANEFESLDYSDFQRFMKRLRKATNAKIRFFMCGEYGEKFSRPHFHACLFGYDFSDKVVHKTVAGGSVLYRSPLLERLWPDGFSSIGEVNFQTAAYTARYVLKKVNGDLAENHYEYIDPGSGEILRRVPEFCRMSLKPGIGANWIDRFTSDVYPSDGVVVNGVETKPPRYYDKRIKDRNPLLMEEIQYLRQKDARQRFEDNTDERLAVREKVAEANLRRLKRNL